MQILKLFVINKNNIIKKNSIFTKIILEYTKKYSIINF